MLEAGKVETPHPPREGVGDTKALGNPMKKAAGMKWRWPKRKTWCIIGNRAGGPGVAKTFGAQMIP